jgi:excisionase family DNA binding protein
MSASTNQILLPFAEKEYVDVRRAGRILGIGPRDVLYLYEWGLIEVIDYAKGKRKRVRYQSIVDLCDRLREKYSVRDRRPPLPSPIFRHRDEDLLPFPLADTAGVPEVTEVLGYGSAHPIYMMIEEGRFEAYRLSQRSPWRISRSSVAEYLKGVHGRARLAPSPQALTS